MEGNRDSELCLLVEGEPSLEIKIDGDNRYRVVPKIHQLRKNLMSEHFAIDPQVCGDMLKAQTRKAMWRVAEVIT